MALLANLRELEQKDLRLKGQLPAADLDLEGVDEVIHVSQPLKYDLEVQKLEGSVLAQGTLDLTLDCECVRCLKPFKHRLKLTGWACLMPLEGEEKAPMTGDFVDLTPYVREDILLEFPQHPLCEPECGGLQKKAAPKKKKTDVAGQTKETKSAWAELNKLKF